MLNQRQKIAIRRHLGVPFAGTAQAGRLFGWRFEVHVEDLEYKMDNLQPAEESLITGAAMGSFRIGGQPTAGDVISYTATDSGAHPWSYTVTPADLVFQVPGINGPSPLSAIALNSALAANAAIGSLGYSAVGVPVQDQLAPAYVPPMDAELIVTAPGTTAFTLGVSVAGTTNATVLDQGATCPVNATLTNAATGVQTAYYGYVAVLDALAMGQTEANLSLWLSAAAGAGGGGVTFRPDELRVREALYRNYIAQLSRAIGGEAYVQKFGSGRASGSVA